MKRIILIGLLAGYLWTDAAVADTAKWERDADLLTALSTCAATNAIVAGQMDGAFAEALTEMATWYANHTREKAVELGYTEEFANRLMQNVTKSIQALYNSGHNSWEQIVGVAESCARERIKAEE